jgi:hypothetical protein
MCASLMESVLLFLIKKAHFYHYSPDISTNFVAYVAHVAVVANVAIVIDKKRKCATTFVLLANCN